MTVIVLAVLYFVAGKLSLKLAFLNASASPVWPPAGIALAAVLLLGYRVWPAIFVGAFLVNLTTAGNLLTSLGIAAGNTLEAVAGAWLVHRFAGGTQVFDRAQGVFKFALAVIVSTLISPTLGLTSLALGGFADWANYGAIWLTWWLGDIAGDLVVAPLIILWSGASTRRWDRAATVEVISLLLLLVRSGPKWFSAAGFRSPPKITRSLSSAGRLLSGLPFASRNARRPRAFSFSPRSPSGAHCTATVHSSCKRENESLLILQTSTAVLIITAMALAAAMAERRRAEAVIEQQRAAVEAANRTKDNFLAMLSHELRTPLTPVLAALDALKTESPRRTN